MTEWDVYLLGPMTGYPENNHPLFNQWAKKLRADGLSVLNPAELDMWMPKLDNPEDYYARDCKVISLCRGGVALPGWRRSRGATWESYTLGSLLRRPVFEGPNLDIIPAHRLPQIVHPADSL
jgi:hypothetical protein